jgi:hypothetical protein
MLKNTSISLLIIFSSLVSGQEIKISERISVIAEQMAADESDPSAVEQFSEWLYELAEEPVRINSGDENEISRLFFLTDFQVKALADYVRTSGRIVSPYEIANIPGFDREIAMVMIEFITLEYSSGPLIYSGRTSQTFLSNLYYRSTYINSSSAGSPVRILTRYRIRSGHISGGVTGEKDPGEKIVSGSPPLPDFLSCYLSYEGTKIIKRVVIGDYSARFGQGTNINTGIRTGLSLTTPGYLSGRSEIRPYTSSDENNFFRGAGAELALKNFDLSLFLSYKKTDATLNDNMNRDSVSVRSLYTAGLHTDSGTLLKKDNLSETGYGVNLSYSFRKLRTGFCITGTRFSLPVLPDTSNPYNRFDFAGRSNNVYTTYYNCLIRRIILFGELSASGPHKFAIVQGVGLRPSDRLNINLLYRNYSPGYKSFHGNGLAGGSSNSNEYGLIANFTFEVAKYLFLSAGTDLKYHPWVSYRCSAPSMERRYQVLIKYLSSEKLIAQVSYDNRLFMEDSKDENRIPSADRNVISSVKGSLKYSISDFLTIGTRVDYKIADPGKRKGFLLLQDINLKFKGLPVSFWLRFAIFNTDDYESGIFTWENDLLNTFSIPVLYGEGSRSYIMVSWKIAGKAEVRIKYGITSTSEINNRMKEISDLKFQFRIFI